MAEINAYCKICGTGYHVCKSCGNIRSFTPWRMVADNINHYSIFVVLHQYTLNNDKDAARKELLELDLSDKDTFLPKIQARINEILGETVVEANTVPEIVSEVVSEMKEETEEVQNVEEKAPIKMKYMSKKRSNRFTSTSNEVEDEKNDIE